MIRAMSEERNSVGNDLDLEVSPDTGLIPDMVMGSINGISGVVNFEM